MDTGQDVADLLAGLTLFADLPRPELESAAHTFEEEWFTEGQRILRQGFTGANFYIILEGEAEVRIDGSARTKLGRGDFFGEVSILLGEPPTADIVAAGALRCVSLPGHEVRRFLESHPRVMYRVLQAEARRLATTLRWLG
jgi:CRP-like cAMP-binding protein